MEGDAGASRLNPNDSDDSSCSEVTAEDSASEVTAEDSAESEVGADQTSTAEDGTDQETNEVTAEESASEVMAEDFEESEVGADQKTAEVTAEDSAESEVGADQTSTAEDGTDQETTEVTAEESASEVTAEDSAESEVGADQTSTEVMAEDFEESEVGADQTSTAEDAEDATEAQDDAGIPSRLGRGWFVGIAAALVVLAGGVGAGGYLALRSHLDSQAIARRDAAAMEAAKNCVAATQAPDTTAMAASAQKMIDCGTGAYRSQAILYSSLLVEAYQAANAHVQVSDLRAAVERNNPDGSVDVLVPLRVKVSNSESQNQEAGYRLRVTMVSDEGQYRIAKLDQVAK
jgi:Mce-associated membrane protein